MMTLTGQMYCRLLDKPESHRGKPITKLTNRDKKVIATQFEHVSVQDVAAQLQAVEQLLSLGVLAHIRKPLQGYQQELKIAICHKLAIVADHLGEGENVETNTLESEPLNPDDQMGNPVSRLHGVVSVLRGKRVYGERARRSGRDIPPCLFLRIL